MKQCKRCHKYGKWYEDICSRCRKMIRQRELTKSPYREMGYRREVLLG